MQCAHVTPTKIKGAGRGMERRYIDVIRNPGKYRPMCAGCHRTFDALVKLWHPAKEEPIPF